MATDSSAYFPGFEFSASDQAAIDGAIRAAMKFGQPQDVAMRPTFYFDEGNTYAPGTALSAGGVPFDMNAEPVPESGTGLQVLCAVEEREGEADETTVGSFEAKELILTFLAAEWAQVSEFTYVMIGGLRYKRSYPLPPVGLQATDVIQIRVEAEDV